MIRSNYLWWCCLFILSGCVTVLLGCDQGEYGLVGEILIDGSSTVGPISTRAKDYFKDEYPNVDIQISISGTGGGFNRFVKGEINILDASRPIERDELNACRENSVKFIEIPIAYDGLTIAIHPDNDWAETLTLDQIKKIFNSSFAAKNWRDVEPNDPTWPNKEIKLYIPDKESGTFDYFEGVVAGRQDSIREDVTPSADDNQLIVGISRDKYAIGFFGVAYYVANKDKIKAVSVVNPKSGKPELPTAETIKEGRYAPFSRPLMIYVASDKAGAIHIKRFVEFYIKEGAKIASESKYVGLPEETYETALQHFRGKVTGTHFLNKDGDHRTGSIHEIYTKENAID